MSESTDRIWKALADPTRRALMDALRAGPQTTGALCEAHASMSRFGVMKHLSVLHEAGLVLVRPRGRERWHYLNAMPLREVYRRWVDRYSEFWSSSLESMQSLVENNTQQQGEGIMQSFKDGSGIDRFEIAQELKLKAPRAKVWKALTQNIGKWWAFRLTDGGTVSLSASLGGQFKEVGTDGTEILWGTVVRIAPEKLLRLNGPLGMGDAPVNSLYTYELEGDGNETLLKLSHQTYGIISDEAGAHHDQGWSLLLSERLKAFVEDDKVMDPISK